MKKNLTLSLLIVFITLNIYSQDNEIVASNDLTYESSNYDDFYSQNSIISEEFNSEVLKKRLEELNQQTPFNVAYNATVERFIRLYLKTRKSDISNLMDKAQYYFPIFEEYLDKYDLPLEIKYLAVVESALDAEAKSIAGAKGIWQIMYHTGKQYNLEVTSYIDERSDVIKATKAACQYLQYLHERFNDWDLALAAYNSGPGNVSKAIRRSGGMRNYWNIRKYLPKETSSYVPAFYATYYLFEYGAKHQIQPNNTAITFHQTDTILVKNKLTFNEIKQRTGIDKKLLDFLNPQYKLGIIPASKQKKYALTLPKKLVHKFETNKVASIAISTVEKPTYIIPTKHNSYVVRNGDNLPKIARKFNISVYQLKKWNGLETDYLIENQRLVITKNNINNTIATSVKERNNSSKKFKTYIVKEGDSLWKISRRFPNITISQLRNWNDIWGVNHVKPGTKIKILTEY